MPDRLKKTAGEGMSLSKFLGRSFTGGIAWGVGTVIGATLVVAVLSAILQSFDFVPIVGELVSDIVDIVESRDRQ